MLISHPGVQWRVLLVVAANDWKTIAVAASCCDYLVGRRGKCHQICQSFLNSAPKQDQKPSECLVYFVKSPPGTEKMQRRLTLPYTSPGSLSKDAESTARQPGKVPGARPLWPVLWLSGILILFSFMHILFTLYNTCITSVPSVWCILCFVDQC